MDDFESDQLIYLVVTNEENKINADKIANILLREKLSPCVTFKNIESCFWWEGEINQSNEVQLIVKCKKENIKKIFKMILKYHSYEIPEIIYFPVSANKDYHYWVNSF